MNVPLAPARRAVLRPVALALAIALAVAMACVMLIARAGAATTFAQRCGIHFCFNGKTFYFAGANTNDVFTYGGSWGETETTYMDKARIDAHFTRLQADKVTVL